MYSCVHGLKVVQIPQGFLDYHKLFGGGDLLSATILGPHQGRNQMGGRPTSGDLSGTESDEGDLEKIVC